MATPQQNPELSDLKRPKGGVYPHPQSPYWYIWYWRDGKSHTKSSRSEDRQVAENLLRELSDSLAERVCTRCNNKFWPKQDRQTICTRKCRRTPLAKLFPETFKDRECAYCGRSFTPFHKGDKYCCELHRKRAGNARNREKIAEAKRIVALGHGNPKLRMPRGAKKKPEQEKRYFQIGTEVNREIPIFDQLFATKRTLPDGVQRNHSRLGAQLRGAGFTQDQVDAAIHSRNSLIAARRFVAGKRNLEFDVVAQYHKRFKVLPQRNPV